VGLAPGPRFGKSRRLAIAAHALARRQRFEAVVQHATGRPVIGFMSGNQQNPDLICEVFVLSPTDLCHS
jgi:hypothetical protein